MTEKKIRDWFTGRLPDDWFTEAPEIRIDREEIAIVGTLVAPDVGGEDRSSSASEAGRIKRFREETRGKRMKIADEAEARFGRKVAWGARCGDRTEIFTSLSVPVMTRLRQPERQALDTLVDAGVARSRSEALAWCVRLVGQHEGEWIQELRDALVAVHDARESGPSA